jgi:hypothetical protein
VTSTLQELVHYRMALFLVNAHQVRTRSTFSLRLWWAEGDRPTFLYVRIALWVRQRAAATPRGLVMCVNAWHDPVEWRTVQKKTRSKLNLEQPTNCHFATHETLGVLWNNHVHFRVQRSQLHHCSESALPQSVSFRLVLKLSYNLRFCSKRSLPH